MPLFSMLDADRIERLGAERGTVAAAYDTHHGARVRFATATGPCVVDKAATLRGAGAP
ncbi:hypothetical protein [Micromonospora craniellae]|uniref:hypothetical protein n=1 Tax=Micromonospora craniellae TaxID=2294034 RepID=UPI001314D255|nr:hypothetical protein [Micromonospora craniellae]QOC92046.1 hypothetical protein ID554_30025 [Micromonospora craniellae]